MIKCSLVGCNNNAEQISRPGMRSGMYCKKHFFAIYYGEDIVEVAKSTPIESQLRAILTDVIRDKFGYDPRFLQ